jgi:hypothetical protein
MVQAVVGQVRTELSEQQNQSTTALTLTPVDLAIIRPKYTTTYSDQYCN